MAENGNIAALRAALELAVDYSEYIVDHLPDEFAGEIHAASEILEKCDAALAAPPRNCDRFGPYKQARSEWWETEVLPRVYGVISGAEKPFDEWLFDLATEQKGDK